MNADNRPIRRIRFWLLPVGAAALGALLLLTWLNVLAAGDRPAPPQQTGAFDFSISKTAIPDIFVPGASNNGYEIIVRGTSYEPGEASSLRIEDNLPAGFTWNPAAAVTPNWNCVTFSTETFVNCSYTGVISTTIAPLQFVVNVPGSAQSPAINTARVVTVPADSNAANNTTTIQTLVTDQPVDLSIQKSVSPTGIISGTITYSLNYANAGTNPALPFVITDTLPVSLTFVSASGGVTPDANRMLTWNEPGLAAGGSGTKNIVMRVTTAESGRQFVNTARITANPSQDDVRPENNLSSVSLTPGGLEIVKQLLPQGIENTVVRVGQNFIYDLQVPPPPAGSFTGLVISDTLDAGLNFVSARVMSGLGSVTYNTTTRTVRFSYPVNTGFGQLSVPIRIEIVAHPGPTVVNQELITNTATLAWQAGADRLSVRSNETRFVAGPGGTLVVSKSDGRSVVTSGESISYTVNVTNTGNIAVSNVVITDTLISNLTSISISSASLGTTSCTGAVRCVLRLTSPLTAGQKVTFSIGARVVSDLPAGAVTRNEVYATGQFINEINDTVNITSVTAFDQNNVTASPDYDIAITKSVTPSQAQVGENLTFRITATNNGDETIPDLLITDEFETVLDLTTVTTNRGTATSNNTAKTVEVDVGDLRPGQQVRVDIVTRVNTSVTEIGSYENRARAEWSGDAVRSNIVRFRVLPSATLPGTGIFPRRLPPAYASALGATAPAQQGPPVSTASLVLGLALVMALLGGLLLLGGLISKMRHPLRGSGTARLGLGLLAVSIALFAVGAVLLPPRSAPSGGLGMLAGTKPPLATRSPQELAAQTSPAPGDEEPSLPGPAVPGITEPGLEPTPGEPGTFPGGPAPTEPFYPGEATHTPDPSIAQYLPTPTPRVLPDYPIPSPTAMVAQGPNGIQPDASRITRLVIPSLGLDAVVRYVPYNGKTWLIGGLRQEIAWMGDTSWPGLGGNTGLAGHVDLADGSSGPFWNLKNLKSGDTVQVYTQQNMFTYQVRQQRVVSDHDLTVVAATNQPQLTLITCADWDPGLSVYLSRLVVFADLATVQPVTQGSSGN